MPEISERVMQAFGEAHRFSLDGAFLGYVGSQSHGTYVPKEDADSIDDVDVMGVVIPPPPYFAGLDSFEHWTHQRDELDVVVYSLQKFARLLLKGNPNVLGLLWLREADTLIVPAWWVELRAERHLFAAKSVYASFAGYAAGQLERMTSYSPVIDAEISRLTTELDAAGWHLQDVMDKRPVPMPKGLTADEANTKAQRLRSLRAKFHTAYMGEKRKGLVRRHGYDTKNAAHLIRLLRMGGEFLRTGELQVFRTTDADELRAIKRGEWALDDVKAHAETLFADCRAAKGESPLPAEPDFRRVSDLVRRLTLSMTAPRRTEE